MFQRSLSCSTLVRSALTAGAVVLALAALSHPSDAQANGVQRYVRAKDSGAKLFNLADKSSITVGTAPAKGLMEVYGENAGYLSVDVPGGMEVWVYGQYVHTTSAPGVVEVNGNGVFMRPLPKSDESSYPLQPQLHKGDRLRVIGRNDPKKPLSEDWVKVVSPAGSRAWVVADDTVAVDTKEDVRTAWAAAVKSANAARPTFDLATGKPAVAAAATAGGAATAANAAEPNASGQRNVAFAGAENAGAAAPAAQDASFANAEKLYEAARTSPNPDWNGVRAAYQSYLSASPNGTHADQARTQLKRVELHEEIVRIQNESAKGDSTRNERLAAARARLAAANQVDDPLWGRFQARGWIVREQPVAAAAPRFVVYWAGKAQAELVCSSGRYDLSKFANYEVGVTGALLRPAVPGSDTTAARPARVDATRLEVLGARSTPH